MTTIAPGQLVLDTETQRIWRIVGPYGDDTWTIEMVEDPTRMRPAGDRTVVRDNWLQRRCIDYSTAVDPPKGNGPQICSVNGSSEPFRMFNSAQECIDWFIETLEPDDVGCWFGWQDIDGSPDLTCTLVDGTLVWENGSS